MMITRPKPRPNRYAKHKPVKPVPPATGSNGHSPDGKEADLTPEERAELALERLRELEAEARSQPALLKAFGGPNSAAKNRALVKKQYDQITDYLGTKSMMPQFLLVCFTFLLALLTGGLGWFGLLSSQDPQSTVQPLPGWVGGIVGAGVGVMGGMVLSVFVLAWVRFKVAYGPVTVLGVSYRDPERRLGRQVAARTNVNLLRMASVTRQAGRYIGPEGHNSFATGRTLLEYEGDLSTVTDTRVFYDCEPHKSSWSGMFASTTNSWYGIATEAGRLKRKRDMGRDDKGLNLDPVGNVGLIVIVLAIAFAAISSCSGFDSASFVQDTVDKAPYMGTGN